MNSCISDVNLLLLDIIETRDSLITITIQKHLDEKLWPMFAMLNKLEGVSEEAEENEKKLRDAQITLEARKMLFPPWFMERILTEATENLSIHKLELVTYFELENTMDLQLDFPITPEAFLFHRFEVVANVVDSDEGVM
ncbi:unnamed protein product [Lactuca saligna]|uniref:Uncharacterized protein n=1 Tax=Lactuca saligna TaxID=75948 RepID=A0AA35YUW9_LACSI|nr:unnamed protein product [Lactuca saligna]